MRGRRLVNWLQRLFVAMAICSAGTAPAYAEDGYDLWLRYAPLQGGALADLQANSPVAALANGTTSSATLDIAMDELSRGFAALQGVRGQQPKPGSVTVLLDCGEDVGDGLRGYRLQPELDAGRSTFVVAAEDHLGCLYGSFALLRELSTGKPLSEIAVAEAPAMPMRMLNHWDNPDGHVERGYAGRSIFDWWHLPERLESARAPAQVLRQSDSR